jgi:ribosome maturation factor RimP
MLSKDEIWEELRKVVEPEGLGLFEVECASGDRGVLRVFLCKPDGSTKGVGLQECTRVAQKINDLPNVDDLIPGNSTLEVSTPGINRRLRRPDHFRGAVGERVKLSVIRPESDGVRKKEVVRGVVRALNEGVLEIVKEKDEAVESIPLEAIAEARVDFLFK